MANVLLIPGIRNADDNIPSAREEVPKRVCNNTRNPISNAKAAIEPSPEVGTPATERTLGTQAGSKRKALETEVAHARSVFQWDADDIPHNHMHVSSSLSLVGRKDKVSLL